MRSERLPLPAIVTLTAAGFLAMVTEVIPAGVLPQISADLGVTDADAGQLVSLLAGSAAVTAIPLIALTRRAPRKPVFLSAVVTIGLGNAVTAVSESYELTLAARLVAGVGAGVLWSMMAGYATRMVSPHNRGRALAISTAGLPLALAVGIPGGTFIGSVLDWRVVFAALAASSLLVVGWGLRMLPVFPGEAAAVQMPIRQVIALPGVTMVLLAALLFEVGHFTVYTYIALFLERASLADQVDTLLLLFGIAALAGLFVTGPVIDVNLRSVAIGSLALLVACMVSFIAAGTVAAVVVATIAAWGFAIGIAPTMFMAATARVADRASDPAQAMVTTVLIAGVALGALCGGVVLDLSSVTALPWVSVVLLVLALAIALATPRTAFPPGRWEH